MVKGSVFNVIKEQLTCLSPPLQSDLTNKVVMVTGANTGIGLEAAKIFAGLHPKKLIVACRSEEKGKAAIAVIEKATGYHNIEAAVFDQGDFGSVIKYTETVKDEPLDILVANAALAPSHHELTKDGWESTLQVNHLATALLSFLLLPNLIRTGQANGTTSRLTIVSSDMHYFVNFGEDLLDAPSILRKMSAVEYCASGKVTDRYASSKLVNIFFTRALSEHLPRSTPLIVDTVNPGFCRSNLRRHASEQISNRARYWIMEHLIARTSEEGARQLVWAALGPDGKEGRHLSCMRGAYVSTQAIREPSDFVISREGGVVQEKIWEETVQVLSQVAPDVKTYLNQYLV
ncbi:hypothetical protein EIP86_001320 [Pleurotus ostreatoroseus]|nr:hypothetical protein EIP86_001320 [Pleurotus ostreatoroseus]